MPDSRQRLVKSSRVVRAELGFELAVMPNLLAPFSMISHQALLVSFCSLPVIPQVTSLPLPWGGPQFSGTFSVLLFPHTDPPKDYHSNVRLR